MKALPIRVVLGAVLAALLLATSSADAAVRIRKKPVVVKYHEFDPKNPPKEMPKLEPGEAALCVSNFGAGVGLDMRPTSRKLPGGKYRGAFAVDNVEIELDLTIDIYLPIGCGAKLRAHEEGHRQIAEKVYNEVSDRAARVAGDSIDRKRYEADGDTVKEADAAAREVLTKAHRAMIEAYLDETSRAGKKVQEEFDRITQHGTNNVTEAEGIERAWAKHTPRLWVPPKPGPAKPGSATKPAAPAAK